MTESASLLQFAAEFVLFLAAAAGLGSLLLEGDLRGQPTGKRTALALGFALLAVSAFLRGSQLVGDGETAVVVALRGGGALAAAAGALRWSAGPPARTALWLGLGLLLAAGGADLADASTITGFLLVAGAALLGLSVFLSSRRSIATQVATSAAGTLLIVVLVLGVALSAVLLNTVQDAAADRLERRVRSEATRAKGVAALRATEARVVAGSLSGTNQREALEQLATRPTPSTALSGPLANLSENFLRGVALAYVARSGTVQGAVELDANQLVELTGSKVVREALSSGDPRESVEAVAGRGLAIWVEPVPVAEPGAPLGVALAASPLDRTYLERAAQDDDDLSLSVLARDQVLASFRRQPAASRLYPLVAQALDGGGTVSTVLGSRFVTVTPITRADGDPVLALVASTPTSLIEDTRNALFRNLFVIALSGSIIALLLAALIGRRIGARLRRLTGAAEAIQRGELGARAGIVSDDEVGVLGMTFDAMATAVEEKTVAESALRGRLEAVVAGMGEALVAVDRSGLVTDFNRAAADLVGLVPGQAVGRPLDDVVVLSDEDGQPLARRLASSSGPVTVLGFVERSDGARVPVSVSAGALGGVGAGSGGSVLVLRDLRPEQQVEQMKNEFISDMSHELRTPLTKIDGFAHLLRKIHPGDEVTERWSTEILAQSKVLLRIVEMQEFFVSAAAGPLVLQPEPVAPGDLVDDAVRRWRARSTSPRTIARRVSPGLPLVMGDKHRLARCLDELIDNAVKFSPQGARVVVSAAPVGGHEVAVSVRDRGIGMSAEEQERAFQPLVQADPSATREFGGLGLGLAFVQRVVEAHGGRLECESAPETGSKLSIVLPSMPIKGKR